MLSYRPRYLNSDRIDLRALLCERVTIAIERVISLPGHVASLHRLAESAARGELWPFGHGGGHHAFWNSCFASWEDFFFFFFPPKTEITASVQGNNKSKHTRG